MNKREEQRLNELLAKKEAEEKADKEFFKQVKKRKDEVLKVLKVDISNDYENRLKKTADKYGCTIVELLDYIETDSAYGLIKPFSHDDDYSMVFIMPKQGNLDSFIDSLEVEDLDSLMESRSNKDVCFIVPSFTSSSV